MLVQEVEAKTKRVGGRPTKYPKPNIIELDALYAKYTAKQLAGYYGVPYETVKMWIRDYKAEAIKNPDIGRIENYKAK